MVLPEDARSRAIASLQRWLDETLKRDFPLVSTIPLTPQVTGTHSESLIALIRDATEVLGLDKPSSVNFNDLRDWAQLQTHSLTAVRERLSALARFEPFGSALAVGVLGELCQTVRDQLNGVRAGREVSLPAEIVSERYLTAIRSARGDVSPLRTMFGGDREPVDDRGVFRPDIVIGHFAYRTNELMSRVGQHLLSLGLAPVSDASAGVAVVGWIASSPDPPLAAWTMHIVLDALSVGESRGVRRELSAALRSRETIGRKTHALVMEAMASVAAEASSDRRAQLLTGAYRHLVEGSIRPFVWAILSLRAGRWTEPPSLSNVRDAMLASDEFLRRLAISSVFVGLRNAFAHETLEWDGFDEVLRGEGDVITLSSLEDCVRRLVAFDRGCHAALAFDRAMRASEPAGWPAAGDLNRMPEWSRAEAFFGSNGIRLVDLAAAGAVVRVKVERLGVADVNPCFQALGAWVRSFR
ncbi:hypothetical protein AB2L57_15815 [Microbacterium sp. HA-8]|uniref:hypothetical protein n=1 Tax=Microbacterium sp. HA-8 TaxID=3234200 RepID=UPI0038F7F3C8